MKAGRISVASLGALTQIVFAVLLAGVSAFAGASAMAGSAAPDFVPRPLVLFGAYALPGLVGWIAIDRGRPAALLAAGGASAVGSFLAFSGVTLIFLLPATLMAAGALGMSSRPTSARSIAIEGGRAMLILVLLVAAGATAILITDERCWDFPNGSGCSNGLISARGVGLGGALGIGALALAALPIRRRAIR